MTYPVIELRVIGPMGRPYIELENELVPEFEREGVIFRAPRLFSAPEITTVFAQIGIGVSVYVLSKLIDRLLDIRKRDNQTKTEITINIEINNNNYQLPEEVNKLINDYSKVIEKQQNGDNDV